MMHPEPIILSHRDHLRLIDENSLEALYDNQMLSVARAMYEPEPSHKRRSHRLGALALNCLLWFGILGVISSVAIAMARL